MNAYNSATIHTEQKYRDMKYKNIKSMWPVRIYKARNEYTWILVF